MIRVENLHRSIAGLPVLRGIDLHVEAGEVLALIGPSGTGKSVLLKHIIGLLEPDSGEVTIAGQSITRASFRELTAIRRGIGYVFQDGALLDSLSIRENLRLALDDRACARDAAHAHTRIAEALAAVNLPERVLDALPDELSGGMRKRAAVARAVINRPRVLLYDEPTTGLDPRNVATIHELILSNRERYGAASIVVTHDVGSLLELADRVALLDDGRVRFIGPPAALFTSDHAAVHTFIGRAPAGNHQRTPWQATRAAAMH
jgi:phospholipid/cholesterol/gamma-HCH transport system ATP-binding protein